MEQEIDVPNLPKLETCDKIIYSTQLCTKDKTE